jgi:type I restriction enzyme, S subunit
MNAAQVLDHFERICDAPDAIPRLRHFILDLAVRGKLVEQDPNDEPASELLKRIEAETAGLVKTGRIRAKFAPPRQEGPFMAPSGWEWTHLAMISLRIQYGFTASANNSATDVRLLRITDIQNNSVNWSSLPGCEISESAVEQYELHQSDILIARTGGTIGKTFLVGQVPMRAVFASYFDSCSKVIRNV